VEAINLGSNATAIYQELVDGRGVTAACNGVKHACANQSQSSSIVWSSYPAPQVDFGEGALAMHPRSGKYRMPRLFIMALRRSRRSRYRMDLLSCRRAGSRERRLSGLG
jgi:hypothetical protein